MTKHRDRQKERRAVSAKALRAAGYVPIPRWWVTPAQLDVIARMAGNHDEHVNEIRNRALGRNDKKTRRPKATEYSFKDVSRHDTPTETP